MTTPDRVAMATKFVAALHDVSRRNPASWRRISAMARTGIKGDEELDQVVDDVVTAGLVERRVDGVVLHKHNGKRRPAWGSGGAVLLMRQSAVYGGR